MRSLVGRWSWAAKAGLLSLRVVPQQQCNGHCPCGLCPSTAVETAIAQCTSRWAIAEGTPPRHFHCSGGGPRSLRSFPGDRYPRSSFTLSSLSPSLISHVASVDVKQKYSYTESFFPTATCSNSCH